MPDLSLPDPEPSTLSKIALQVPPEQWKLSQAEMVEVIINEPGNRMEILFSVHTEVLVEGDLECSLLLDITTDILNPVQNPKIKLQASYEDEKLELESQYVPLQATQSDLVALWNSIKASLVAQDQSGSLPKIPE